MKKKILLFTAVVSLGFGTAMRGQTNNYVPTDGLVAYYPFNGNANDGSGNGYNGSVIGATLTSDRFGNLNSAYSFNGINNKISLSKSTNMLNGTFTISSWVTIENLFPTNYDVIVIGQANGSSNGSQKWQVGYRAIKPKESIEQGMSLYLHDNTGSGISSGYDVNWIPKVSTWYHVTWVFLSGNYIKVYIDGNLQYTLKTSLKTWNNLKNDILTEIGVGHDESKPLYWNGKIDDLGIWNRELSLQEIKDLYNANICYQNVTVTDALVINIGLLSRDKNPMIYQNTITIAPNPAKDHIIIDSGNLTSMIGYRIKISNSLSQEVYNKELNEQQFTVPILNWGGTGLYFVHIIDNKGRTIDMKKIILE